MYSSRKTTSSTGFREQVENMSVPMIVEGLRKMKEEGWRNTILLCSEGMPIVASLVWVLVPDPSTRSVPRVEDQASELGPSSRSLSTARERIEMLVLELVRAAAEITEELMLSAAALKANKLSE